jgi:diguanylate cyclase (GGDEF)-like protein
LDGSLAFAERLREAVATTRFTTVEQEHRMTISIGLAHLDAARADRSALMRAADAALYQAKDAGRNRVQLAE